MSSCLRTGAVALFAALLFVSVTHAQRDARPGSPRRSAALEELNARLAEVVRLPANPGQEEELAGLSSERMALLADLIVVAPGEVLRLAFPPDVRDSFPVALRAGSEEHVELNGTVEVAIEDHRGFSRMQHVLQTDHGRYSLHFPGNAPGWSTGQQVQLRGVRVDNKVAVSGSSVLTASDMAALAGSTGTHRVALILVNFRDNPGAQPYSTAQAADMLFNTTSNFYRENSGGATSLTGDVFGWFTIDMESSVCDNNGLASLARQAASNAGANLSLYSHYMYAFPQNACWWWGLGSVGGAPSNAWVNGDFWLDVTAHELGHNFGLYHSRNMDCGSVPIGPSCTVDEYGDVVDMMGATKGHFNAFQKDRLGWLGSQLVNVPSSGTYFIEPFENSGSGVKVLKVLKSVDPTTGQRTFYYLELRQPIGFDWFMSGWTNVINGVTIHTGSESNGNSSYLLDMTPYTDSWYDPSLGAGATFSDSAAGVSVTVNSVGSGGASVTVNVTNSAPACSSAAPKVALSPGAPTAVAAGTTINYTVTVINNDSSACASTTFVLWPTVPSGWSASFDSTSVSLGAGASASRVFRVTSPGGAAAGTYSVSAKAQDAAVSSHAGSGSANYTVSASFSVQVSTDSTSYPRGGTVVITAYVANGSSPMAGATVGLKIRKADGKTVNVNVTTNAAGVARYEYRMKPRDPVGTYQVTATKSGSTTTATATFVVQ